MFVLITGSQTDKLVEEAYSNGINNIMQKPFDIANIITLMGYLESE